MFPSVVLSNDGVLVAVASLHASIVGLLAHQGSHYDTRVVMKVYRGAFDKAVAQHAVATQSSGECSHAVDRTVGLERTVLNAETLYGADDIVEESHRLVGVVLIVSHLQVLDDITATVVVAFETIGTGSDRNKHRVLQVDVGSLLHIEVAPLHDDDGLHEVHEIFGRTYLIGLLLGAFT